MSGTIYGTPKITTSLTSFDISTSDKTGYDLRVSDGGTEINGRADISGALTVGSPNTIGPLQARYIRFQHVTSAKHINLNEIQVFGLDGIELNKSTWTVAMSSVFSGEVGANLIDENLSTFVHTSNGANEFIEVDMGELKTFSHFKLFNRTTNPDTIGRAIGLTVILKDNAGVEIDTLFLVEDSGVYGLVSGSTSRVITSGNATYTFRNTALHVNGPANISGDLTIGSPNTTGRLQARFIRFQRVTNLTLRLNLTEIEVYDLNGIQLSKSTWTVNASSTLSGSFAPANFIDGNLSTFYHSQFDANSEWIEVDMGELKTFSHFILFNRIDNQTVIIGITVILKDNAGVEIDTPFLVEDSGVYGIVSGSTRRVITSGIATYTFRSFYLLNVNGSANISGALSAGSANLSDSLTVNSNASISGALTIGSTNTTPPLQARYIRFQRVTNEDFINLSEIQVFGTNGVQLDNSTWTVAMSSQHSTHVGANLIDEDFVNFAHTNSGIGQWIEVDMKALRTFSHFILYNRTGIGERTVGLTVIFKDNNNVVIDTPFLEEDARAYGIVSGSTIRVITTNLPTYTFRNFFSLDVNGSANISGALSAGSANITGNLTIQSAESTLNVFSTDDTKNTILNVCGNNQGTGIVYVGQSLITGGGIEYNGDNTPITSGAGADFTALFRRTNGIDNWTARNFFNNNNWEFRGTVTSSSDARLKENIEPLDESETHIKILQLQPKSYQYIDRGNYDRIDIGLIAQEVKPIFPELVFENNGMLSLCYDRVSILMLHSIKQLQKQIDELKNENIQMKNEIIQLKK